jgi:hypothetical protein
MNEVSIHKVSNIKVVNTHRTRREVNAGWSATNEILDGKCFLKQDSSMNIFRAEAKRRKEGKSEKVLPSPPPIESEHVDLTSSQPLSHRKGHRSKSRKSSKGKKDRRSIEPRIGTKEKGTTLQQRVSTVGITRGRKNSESYHLLVRIITKIYQKKEIQNATTSFYRKCSHVG